MRKHLHTLMLLVASVLTAGFTTACGSDDYTSGELSRDCLITEVTLGTLNRTMHTLDSKGEDSTYTVTVTGSMYPMHIDQLAGKVYNPDSLPVGTDVSKVVFSTFNVRYGMSIRSLNTGNDTIFTTTDSTDFRTPRIVKVYAQDATMTREYEVKVNLHTEEPDSCAMVMWQNDATSPLAAMTAMQAVAHEGTVYVVGDTPSGAQPCVTLRKQEPQSCFDVRPVDCPIGQLRVHTLRVHHGAFYALAGQTLVTAAHPAGPWLEVPGAPALDDLAGSGADSLYALSGGQMLCSADGITWQATEADEPHMLPTADACIAAIPARHNDNMTGLVLYGTRDGQAVTWHRDVYKEGDFSFPWFYLTPISAQAATVPPLLQQASLMPYDDGALLIGLTPQGTIAPCYLTHDGGRSWLTGEMKTPSLQGASCVTAAVDDEHYVWIIAGGTGEVWRLRINRLGWKQQDTRFE